MFLEEEPSLEQVNALDLAYLKTMEKKKAAKARMKDDFAMDAADPVTNKLFSYLDVLEKKINRIDEKQQSTSNQHLWPSQTCVPVMQQPVVQQPLVQPPIQQQRIHNKCIVVEVIIQISNKIGSNNDLDLIVMLRNLFLLMECVRFIEDMVKMPSRVCLLIVK